jgi:hypothetical protein
VINGYQLPILITLDSTGNSKITKNQAGFRRGYCTIDQVFQLHTNIQQHLAKRQPLPVVFVDIKAAYDRIWHDGLMYKAHRLGLTGKAWHWIRAFISNRRISTMYGDTRSDWHPLHSGVPQGSVLAPILFNIYVNDLPNTLQGNSQSITPLLYADDLAIFVKGKYNDESQTQLTLALVRLSVWAKQWKVRFSMDKTNIVVFRSKQTPIDLNGAYHLSGQPITQASSYKYLGVHLHEHMTWKEHEQHVLKKLRMSSHFVSSITVKSSHITAATITQLCKSILYPQISYGWAFWQPSTAAVWDKLTSLCLAPVRRVLSLPRDTHRLGICMLTGLLPLRTYRDQTLAYTALRFMKLHQHHPSRQLYDTCANTRRPRIVKRHLLPHVVQSIHVNGELLQESTRKASIKQHHRSRMASALLTDTAGSSVRQILLSNNTHSISPPVTCSAYLKHDDRVTASVRAKFALDRACLPSQRIRLYREQVQPLCTHPPCHAQGSNMNREHVLLHCQRFQHNRNFMLHALSQLHPSLTFASPPLSLVLGLQKSPIIRKHAHMIASLTGTFIRDIYLSIADPDP